MRLIKQFIRSFFNCFNVTLNYYPRSPFWILTYKKRFVPTVVQLFNKPFYVTDPLTFYHTHRHIFIQKEYCFKTDKEAPVIIDCGANIGVGIVFFRQEYPEADITAVEADPIIFETLMRNIVSQELANINVMNKAIWNESGQNITFNHEGSDAGRVEQMNFAKSQHSVETITIDELIGDKQVDLLKIDIEGAENQSFPKIQKLSQVNNIFLEYHSFVDKPQQLNELLGKLTEEGFRYTIIRELPIEKPLLYRGNNNGMDMQLNIFAYRK